MTREGRLLGPMSQVVDPGHRFDRRGQSNQRDRKQHDVMQFLKRHAFRYCPSHMGMYRPLRN